MKVGEAVVRVQRDHGNREVRANARLKYTIERMGLDAFRAEVEKLCGFKLGAPREFRFDDNGDRYGWIEDHLGNWHFTLYVENGRVYDTKDYPLLTGLREIAKVHTGDSASPRTRTSSSRTSRPPRRRRSPRSWRNSA